MFVFVTGNQGLIGRWMVKRLLEAGHTVRTFDRSAQPRENGWEHIPGDIRDSHTVRKAVQGVDAVIHLAAIPSDWGGYPELVLSTNLQGVMNVLLACAEAGVKRVVNFSSINALGHAEDKPNPGLYLPLDDDVPHYLGRAYNTSKHVGEELCLAFSNQYGMTAVSLRPTAVLEPQSDQMHWWDMIPEERKAFFLSKDLWSYVDVRDVCEAALLGLTAPVEGHQAFLLSAADSAAKVPTAELVEKYYPQIPWAKVSMEKYLAGDPFRSLLDCSKAKKMLGWQPKISMRDPGSGYEWK
jgi:UDP-glucose 4-epimerase